MKKFLMLLLVLFFAVAFVQLNFVQSTWAQPEEEEEEEEMMPYPNPMEMTTKGAGKIMQGRAMGAKQQMGQDVVSETGEVAEEVGDDGKAEMGKGLGVAAEVGNEAAGAAEAMKFDGVDGEAVDPMGGQAAMGMGEGDDTPDNPVNPVKTGAASAYGWGDDDDTPGDPVDPITSGVGEQMMNNKGADISDKFGGKMNIGEGY